MTDNAFLRRTTYGEGFGTHLPLLGSVLAIARPGPVIEVGVGHSSSTFIAEVCKAMGREWHAVDCDRAWLDTTFDLGPTSTICPSSYTDTAVWVRECAVAFVDCSPGMARLPVVQALRSHAEFIVVHDTDNICGDIFDLVKYLNEFPYHFTYDRMQPWTTVVSDTRAYPAK